MNHFYGNINYFWLFMIIFVKFFRVGIGFQSMEARHRVSEALERNYERVRLRRLGKTV